MVFAEDQASIARIEQRTGAQAPAARGSSPSDCSICPIMRAIFALLPVRRRARPAASYSGLFALPSWGFRIALIAGRERRMTRADGSALGRWLGRVPALTAIFNAIRVIVSSRGAAS